MKASAKERHFQWELDDGVTAKIRYTEQGTEHADKPPILFLHGYGGMIEHWDMNIPEFASSHKIYAMDLIGFGQSEKPNVRYSLELFATQIDAFLELKKISRVVIVGHSMGAASAIFYAHYKPGNVAALILANPSGLFGDTMDGMNSVFFGLVASPLIGEALFSAFANPIGVGQSLAPTYYNQSKVDSKLVTQFTRPLQDRGASWSYLSPSRRPNDFKLNHLEKPSHYKGKTFLIWGAEDVALPPHKIIPEFQELLPEAAAFIIPKASHCVHHDAHEAFNQRLRQILNTL